MRTVNTLVVTSLASSLALALAACSAGGAELRAYHARDQRVAAQLATFDDLDFRVFSRQQWADLHKSHAEDVIVHWPDGHTTTGLARHQADLEAMFVYAPDTRIETHPIKIGDGEWTAVAGVMEGTFTQPMPLPDGSSIPPTGKAFKITMATLSHWRPDGAMSEEYLFWDNATFMAQLGLGH
jgi:SnoaL-like polyketide cyclase